MINDQCSMIDALDPPLSPAASKNSEPHRAPGVRGSGFGNSPESSPADRMEVTFEIADFASKS
jgi:hypothetical protein